MEMGDWNKVTILMIVLDYSKDLEQRGSKNETTSAIEKKERKKMLFLFLCKGMKMGAKWMQNGCKYSKCRVKSG